ncbi:hypothetical protein FGO68_gene3331 [Halteria grandinella]|uniref:Uncharacterized protein n=1 Tax=Halteria grandinella TaxID=5974 RepID=A0A8J8NET4_HALGN|nr:hypothetical protein FGO68_gene3331 [Halteria grandinella]
MAKKGFGRFRNRKILQDLKGQSSLKKCNLSIKYLFNQNASNTTLAHLPRHLHPQAKVIIALKNLILLKGQTVCIPSPVAPRSTPSEGQQITSLKRKGHQLRSCLGMTRKQISIIMTSKQRANRLKSKRGHRLKRQKRDIGLQLLRRERVVRALGRITSLSIPLHHLPSSQQQINPSLPTQSKSKTRRTICSTSIKQ